MLQKEYKHRCSEPVRAATYSPKADLLAVATEDNRLTVHRLAIGNGKGTFQKLFTIGFGNNSTLPPITALTWRPDGRTLALGHDDGSFSVYHIQNQTKIRLPKAARPHSERVTCLQWQECDDSLSSSSSSSTATNSSTFDASSAPFPHHPGGTEDLNEVYDAYAAAYGNDGDRNHNNIRLGPSREGRGSRLSHVPPKPRSLTKEDGGGGLSSDAAADREQEETEFALTQGGSDQSFTILASGDSTGVVTLSAYGYFPVGCVDLSGAFVAEDNVSIDRPTVCNVRMTPDVSTLTVTLRARVRQRDQQQQQQQQQPSSSSSSSSNAITTTPTFRYHICHVDTSLLYQRRYELSEVALHFGAIGELLEHMKETFVSMKKTWMNGVQVLDTKWDAYVQKIENNEKCSVIVSLYNFHYNSCNYRCCDFFYLIFLLMSFIESHLSNKPKQCIQKVLN